MCLNFTVRLLETTVWIAGKSYDIDYIESSKGVPKCECGGIIKPDVVLYEEMLK